MAQRLSIPALLEEWDINPFSRTVWFDITSPITREEVASALEGTLPSDPARASHVQRVAAFVADGWSDPINVDLGVPMVNFVPEWPILDGNHRFMAAVYRGDAAIAADVSGQVDWIENFLEGSNPSPDA